jgi:hypothetical protein
VNLIVGLLAWPISGFGQQTERERGVPLTIVVRDQAHVKVESLASAKQVVIRIMSAAGFAVTYLDTEDVLNARVPLTDSSQSKLLRCGFLTVVILPRVTSGATPNEAAGSSVVTSGPYRRAYVFFDRVKAFSEVAIPNRREIVGTVLGHVIVHELGHLLMPEKPHTTFGIMRGVWDEYQVKEAAMGFLWFYGGQAEAMRNQMRGQYAASFIQERLAC